MKILGNHNLRLTFSTQLALLLVVSVFLWSVGAPVLFQRAHAANLTLVSDTLSNSNLGTLSGHFIRFNTVSSISTTQTIKIGLDPVGSAFTEIFSTATSTDFSLQAGATVYSIVSVCTAGNQLSAVGNYNNGTDENLTLTLCAGAAVIPATTAVAISIATTTASTKVWTNPAAGGSYRITLGGTMTDSGETRVVALQNVTLTASVNTSFTFTVSGLATSTVLFGGNNATTTASSTATSLPFATLSSTTLAASSTLLAQQLNVTTNARNGFSVTVQENQPPTSSTGATIDLFNNGASTTVPITWVPPTATLDVPSTYGHFGVTSDDGDESQYAANEFAGASKWSGAMDIPKVVFSHTGPSDGVTQNKGKAIVGYRIQISDLQEAGNDYTNTLTYVATPTF